MHRGKGMKFVGDSRVPVARKPNIPKDYSEYPGKTEAFWPNFLLKEWMVGAVFLIGYLCLTVAHPSPLERMAGSNRCWIYTTSRLVFLILVSVIKVFLCFRFIYCNWSVYYARDCVWCITVSSIS